jgi:hypothetical protein
MLPVVGGSGDGEKEEDGGGRDARRGEGFVILGAGVLDEKKRKNQFKTVVWRGTV